MGLSAGHGSRKKQVCVSARPVGVPSQTGSPFRLPSSLACPPGGGGASSAEPPLFPLLSCGHLNDSSWLLKVSWDGSPFPASE